MSSWPRSLGIDGRITWVGVGARRSADIPVGYRGPIVEFDQFKLFDQSGRKLDSIAPALAHHLFALHRRVIMSDGLNDTIQREITKILALASPLGRAKRGTANPKSKCPPKSVKPGICPPRKRNQVC